MRIIRKVKILIASLFLLSILTVSVSAANSQYFDINDLTRPSNLEPQQLELGIIKGLKPLAADFINAEREYGVNAVFLAAVSALESGWGERGWSYKNNIFGYGKSRSFETKADCINYVAAAIAKNYLSGGGKYHRGGSVSAVNCFYNGSDFWETNVIKIMNEISRRINRDN